LYYTESGGAKTGDDITDGIKPKCNCLYRYELVNNKLINPKLLLNLPAYPGPENNGGIVKIGPDRNVYVVIGNVHGDFTDVTKNKALNFAQGPDPDGRAGILRVTPDGKPVGKGILGDKFPLNLYYAYGIRNSFGMDFDPVTKKLWDTENGPAFGDEINLVEPGFNSGWAKMTGIWQIEELNQNVKFGNTAIPSDLVTFGGKGKFRSPEFTWNQTVAPTSLAFLSSDELGKKYQNDMFVADANHGNVYDFNLNENRTGLVFNGSLAYKVAHNQEELQAMIFATGFGPITDLEVGPDGYLYVVAEDEDAIYRIVP
jgi:glucose/arabinose dehydrogenase